MLAFLLASKHNHFSSNLSAKAEHRRNEVIEGKVKSEMSELVERLTRRVDEWVARTSKAEMNELVKAIADTKEGK